VTVDFVLPGEDVRRPIRSMPRSRVPCGSLILCALWVVFLTAAPASAHSHGAARTPGAGAVYRIGDLTVVDAFLPQPPSPVVAAIYLTVRNSGSHADALVAVSSPAAAAGSMLMTENPNGTMGLLRELRVPAHGRASLVPGRDHLMLEQPRGSLAVGQHITVILHFQHAGDLTISVPVVPLERILEHPGS
jgi:periplasmic copper chaperone A